MESMAGHFKKSVDEIHVFSSCSQPFS